jgi:glycerate 2-kinase
MSGATRTLLRRIYDAAVSAAYPGTCLPPALPPPPVHGRLIVLAAGKAAGSMAESAEAHYLDKLGRERLSGIAVTRHGYARPARAIEMIEAGHPMPDAAGLAAAERVLVLADSASRDDLVLVLLSGGASANWIAPARGISLEDKRTLTRALLASGATIGAINTVRKHLSRIKGGRLAAHAAPARVISLAISDVPGDDPSVIGSGPTVPDASTLADARAILAEHRLRAPPSITAALKDPGNESPKAGDPAFAHSEFHIVARPAESLAAAAEVARAAGYTPILLGADLEGDAREVAAGHARRAIQLADAGKRTAILSGGELTVTLKGNGRGGPNQEYALALAIALAGRPGISAVAGDTDGTDGGAGKADDPAGAFVDQTTLQRARVLGLDPARFLAENDSTAFFERIGDLLSPGPTFTNVNDIRAVLVDT